MQQIVKEFGVSIQIGLYITLHTTRLLFGLIQASLLSPILTRRSRILH